MKKKVLGAALALLFGNAVCATNEVTPTTEAERNQIFIAGYLGEATNADRYRKAVSAARKLAQRGNRDDAAIILAAIESRLSGATRGVDASSVLASLIRDEQFQRSLALLREAIAANQSVDSRAEGRGTVFVVHLVEGAPFNNRETASQTAMVPSGPSSLDALLVAASVIRSLMGD